jgi:hypothetical protein
MKLKRIYRITKLEVKGIPEARNMKDLFKEKPSVVIPDPDLKTK